ncbi:MAG TPA: zinc dependent phospholipase C family protein [Candidatus Atribacteria bacterium]|nr:zinc dependent phospholipase C family protein [Candidatus Atribacteria bacterium]
MALVETTYDYMQKAIFGIASPLKKQIIKTQCQVHKYINIQALKILRNDGYIKEYNFFSSYISQINKGAVWVDLDFKSTNHFYNPYKRKGLFGRKSALELGMGSFDKALFYFGAVLHIIHDMTIPQHANIRLMDNHRQYENYVKRTYQHISDFQVREGAYLLDTVREFIRFNARIALKVHKRFKGIADEDKRFYQITKCSLPLAKKTTAGAMVMFYNTIFKPNSQTPG